MSIGLPTIITCMLKGLGYLVYTQAEQHIMLHLCLTQTWAAIWSDSLSDTAICKPSSRSDTVAAQQDDFWMQSNIQISSQGTLLALFCTAAMSHTDQSKGFPPPSAPPLGMSLP